MSNLDSILAQLPSKFVVNYFVDDIPKMTWEEKASQILRYGTQLTDEQFKVFRDELRVYLLSKRLLSTEPFETYMEFHGYGDSGQMEGSTGNELLDDFLETCLHKFVHFDWYNGEGGGVNMEWDLDDDKIIINGYQNIQTTETVMDEAEF